MSIFVVPVQDSFHHHQRPTKSGFTARCGPCVGTQSAWDVDPFHRRNAIPHALFGSLLGDVEEYGDDRDVFMSSSSSPLISPWEQHLAQLRRREQLAEAEAHQRRRAAALQARQQQIERERVRRERERAARLAWQQEQQARAEAAALDYQRRVQAYRKRQEEEYAQRVKLAQRRQAQWEQAASQAFFGVMDIVGQLFGDEESEELSKAEGKKPEKTAANTTATTQEKEKAAEAEKTEEMQVDEPQVAPTETEVTEKTPAAEEQVPVPATTAEAPKEVTQQPSDRLVFTYPLPQDEATRSSIKAKDINVTFDEATRTINLTGLWSDEANNDSSSSSSTAHSEGESRGRKRSRSPKHSRVSDVDETTGEEITKPEEDAQDDEYVQVQTTTKPVPVSVSKSIRLPEDATVDNLRAELTDEGFKIFL